jgi:hypothetical protein
MGLRARTAHVLRAGRGDRSGRPMKSSWAMSSSSGPAKRSPSMALVIEGNTSVDESKLTGNHCRWKNLPEKR